MSQSVQELVAKLKMGTVAERFTAIAGLQKLGVESADARVALVEALTNDAPQIRLAAAGAVQEVGVCAASAFQIVFDVMDNQEEEVDSSPDAVALHALGIYGDRALEFIRVWASDASEDSRTTAAGFLRFLGVEPAVEIPILIELIKSESNEWNMLALLQRIRELPDEATVAVLDVLEEIFVHSNAIEEVINFLSMTPKPKSIAALERLLESDNDNLKFRAAKGLMQMTANKHARAIAALHVLKDTSADEDTAADAALVLESM